LLGRGTCGQKSCAVVLRTTDGGVTWSKVGAFNAPVTLEDQAGVTEIRFADDLHGWAFEPGLYATSDGGVTWERQRPPGNGHLVLALGGDAQAVYAVVTECRFGQNCTRPATLWRTTPGGSWTQVSVTLPAFEAFDDAG